MRISTVRPVGPFRPGGSSFTDSLDDSVLQGGLLTSARVAHAVLVHLHRDHAGAAVERLLVRHRAKFRCGTPACASDQLGLRARLLVQQSSLATCGPFALVAWPQGKPHHHGWERLSTHARMFDPGLRTTDGEDGAEKRKRRRARWKEQERDRKRGSARPTIITRRGRLRPPCLNSAGTS